MATAAKKQFAHQVVEALCRDYGDATCALNFETPLQLLIATILSAQCTDERVNMVTPALFEAYPDAASLAAAPRAQIEKLIQSAGFFRMKAKNIQECCKRLAEEFDGDVPRDLETLVQLPGVGRKTASVVLGTAFGIPSGVVVDTHVTRLSFRLGLTKQKTAEKIERDLIELLPQDEWIDFSHRLIHHGRRICKARKPLCEECSMAKICPKNGVAKSPAPKKGKTTAKKK